MQLFTPESINSNSRAGITMMKEELIKKLEHVELPDMEIPGHRRVLKQVLMQGTASSQLLGKEAYPSRSGSRLWALWEWLKGPWWRPALASALGMLILGAVLAGIFYAVTPSPSVIAADVVKNDPVIQQKLSGSGEIIIVRVEVRDRMAHVVCGRGMGDFIEADVDIHDRTVVNARRFEGLFVAELAPEANENAINIALLDSRVKPMLDRGATIGRVFPVFSSVSSIAISDGNLVKITPAACHAIVPVYVDGKAWLVDVDLDQKKVARIMEPQALFMPYFREMQIPSTRI